MLDIPKSYNTSAINRAVIKPIQKELPQYFNLLKVKAIKKNAQATPIIAYKFTWEPQKSSNQQWINGKCNKKSKAKNYDLPTKDSLATKDNRMTKEERMAFIERRFRQPLPIYEDEEIKNIEGQIDVEEL